MRYRPRLFLPPGNRYPIDFHRDYLPFSALRTYPGRRVLAEEVTPRLLDEYRDDLGVYLDFDIAAYREAGLDVRAGEGPPARDSGSMLRSAPPDGSGRPCAPRSSVQS